jgi:soluble lytic murein transglycosylase-like protein
VRRDRSRNAIAAGVTAAVVAPALLVLAVGNAMAQPVGAPPAATAGDLTARALAYEHGEDVAKDPARAAALYCEALREGDAEAAYGLGWMYANGRGVARDDATAAALFAQAAQRGHAYGQRMLAVITTAPGPLPECARQPAPEVPAVAVERVDRDANRGLVAEPEDEWRDLPPERRRIADLVQRVAPRYALDPRLALAVIAAESNFDPLARSRKDARGLMQLIPVTAARFNVRNVFDIGDNLRGGLAYLRWLLAYYQGSVALAIAAYNAGEATVDRYRGIPPYPETRHYVQKVLRSFRSERHSYDPGVAEPSPIVGASPRGEWRR